MSGRIPREFIDDLLVRVDIVDLIDSHVPLKKTGSSYTARCPFHTEKSPSFSVNRKKQFYHCFGCGVGGNAISFLMSFSHLDFVEAIEDLAAFAGVDVPRESVAYQGQTHDYSALYAVLEEVAVYYVQQLRNHPEGKKAVAYLKSRGISGDVAKEYSLGYALDEWSALESRYDKKQLLESGMLTSNDSDRVYDRFRGRLMFPIRDKRNRIIGFGGRVLDDSLPKYLNSPETPVFSKGNELYGLYELLEKEGRPKRILITEGYMDVLALAQYGIGNAVAALGTATSKIHLDLLFRFTSELVFCFDGDSAGRKAAWRAVKEAFPCLRDGRQIKVMLLPQGQDPDTLIRSEGVNAFTERMLGSQALSDFYFEHLGQGLDLATVEGGSQLLAQAKPDIEKIPAGFFREMMLERLTAFSGHSVLDVLKNPTMLGEAGSNKQAGSARSVKSPQGHSSPARVVISLLLQNPRLIEIVDDFELDWSSLSFPGLDVLSDVVQAIKLIKPENTAVLLEYYRDKPSEKIIYTMVNMDFYIPESGIEAEFSGALERLLQLSNETALNQLVDKEKAQGLDDSEKEQLKKLLKKKSC